MTNEQRQHLLAFLRLYDGQIDGIWGPQSTAAMESLREKYPDLEDDAALLEAVANWYPDNTGGDFWDETEYFTREEFRCKCGGKYCNGYPAEPDERMVRIADAIRKRIGKPITVNSGLRCKTHNANVGGVSNSQHLYGTAADLGCPSSCTPSQMASIAEEIMGETGGIGIYSWGIHIDTRSTKSRWNG